VSWKSSGRRTNLQASGDVTEVSNPTVAAIRRRPETTYNSDMERKIFWISFTVLGVVADVVLPIWWALGATIPIGYASWWIAYRSGWFE
jgi:hypothetical protein